MRKFATHIFTFLLLGTITLEVLIRIFNLAGHTVPQMNINGDILGKPNTDSVWVRGGVSEISSRYHFNPQGWNSLRDYEADSIFPDSTKIALIGDSYIEGFHYDVDKSIGRIFEKKTNSILIVHEFGNSGGNIKDFSMIYNKYNLRSYKLVFILIADGDLSSTNSSFMNQEKINPSKSLTRLIYSSSALLRYLNINHGLNKKINELLSSKSLLNRKKLEDNSQLEIINHDALKNIWGKYGILI